MVREAFDFASGFHAKSNATSHKHVNTLKLALTSKTGHSHWLLASALTSCEAAVGGGQGGGSDTRGGANVELSQGRSCLHSQEGHLTLSGSENVSQVW